MMYPSEPKQKNNNKWPAVVLLLSIAGLIYDNWDVSVMEAPPESAPPKQAAAAPVGRSDAAGGKQKRFCGYLKPPDIIRESVHPMENIDDIKILQINGSGGFSGTSATDGGRCGTARQSGRPNG